jgi:hypothetical protein
MNDQSLIDVSRQAQALIDIMNVITQRPDYQAVWTTAYIHGITYAGPTWDLEFKALQAALEAHHQEEIT